MPLQLPGSLLMAAIGCRAESSLETLARVVWVVYCVITCSFLKKRKLQSWVRILAALQRGLDSRLFG